MLFWLQGLRPDTLFGCLYEYLFEPLPEIKEMFHTELAVMQDSTLKIAIQVHDLVKNCAPVSRSDLTLDVQQIRTGDETMVTGSPNAVLEGSEDLLSLYRAFWHCARVRGHLDLRSCLRALIGHSGPSWCCARHRRSKMSGSYLGRRLSGCW